MSATFYPDTVGADAPADNKTHYTNRQRMDFCRHAGVREEWWNSASDYLRYGDEASETLAKLRENASYMFYREGERAAKTPDKRSKNKL